MSEASKGFKMLQTHPDAARYPRPPPGNPKGDLDAIQGQIMEEIRK